MDRCEEVDALKSKVAVFLGLAEAVCRSVHYDVACFLSEPAAQPF
ncbi:MAG: hypothetical protein RMK31_01215 [Candidatus Caldarchaeum sp.]|nr:hypothetical protein [Candidatus Caldarchaeum sp.]